MDERGQPPRIGTVREMANVLANRGSNPPPTVGQNWVRNFVNRHEELKSKFSRKYDYQRARCEDPEVTRGWFKLVQNTIAKSERLGARQRESGSPGAKLASVRRSQDTHDANGCDAAGSTGAESPRSGIQAPTHGQESRPSVDYGEADARTSTGPVTRRTAMLGQRPPISSILRQRFPSMEVVYALLEDDFDAVHWFSLVVYEPKFRRKLRSIADGFAHPSQKPFLLRVSVILGGTSRSAAELAGEEAQAQENHG
ncbi:hypothetical protein VTO42DRAFT_6480 [Malbranchea cinnamomea]